MNKVYKIIWKREVWFSGEIVINDRTDPRIMAESHMRDGELSMKCHKHIIIDKAEEEIVSLIDEEDKRWI